MSDISLHHVHGQLGWVCRAVQAVRFLVVRQRTRRALANIVDDPHALDDVALTVEQARREYSKWFWM